MNELDNKVLEKVVGGAGGALPKYYVPQYLYWITNPNKRIRLTDVNSKGDEFVYTVDVEWYRSTNAPGDTSLSRDGEDHMLWVKTITGTKYSESKIDAEFRRK